MSAHTICVHVNCARVLRALVVLGLVWPGAVYAAQPPAPSPIQVVDNLHSVTFGQEMRFHLALEGSAPITSIVLAYRTSDTQGTTVETIAFSPDRTVGVEHVHDIGERQALPLRLRNAGEDLAQHAQLERAARVRAVVERHERRVLPFGQLGKGG